MNQNEVKSVNLDKENTIMEGVLYVTDEDNKKRFVQIDLEKYGSIVEDILDRIVIESRKNEEPYPLEDVIKELEEKGNLDTYV